MATIVSIRQNTGRSAELIGALRQISSGFGKLYELNGPRAEAIGASQTVMCDMFGPATTDGAQALSDRWAAVVSGMTDPSDANYADYAMIRDLIQAVNFV